MCRKCNKNEKERTCCNCESSPSRLCGYPCLLWRHNLIRAPPNRIGLTGPTQESRVLSFASHYVTSKDTYTTLPYLWILQMRKWVLFVTPKKIVMKNGTPSLCCFDGHYPLDLVLHEKVLFWAVAFSSLLSVKVGSDQSGYDDRAPRNPGVCPTVLHEEEVFILYL